MTLSLDKSTWKGVRLGDVVRRSRKQVDPIEAAIERYVAGGHIDGDSITIDRWGDPGDGQMGSTFRYVFEPGQLLFVSARPYLRKSGVVDFSGVVADKTYVLSAIPENGLLQEFLPFVLASEPFIAYATAEATGSMNPRLLWGPLQRYAFDLAPLEEQQRIANLLWALEDRLRAITAELEALSFVRSASFEAGLALTATPTLLGDAASIASGVTLGPARRSMPDSAPYLRVANVQRGVLDLDEIKTIGATPTEIASKGIRKGDVLVVEGHASVLAIGRAAIWDRDESPLYQNHLFRVRATADFRPRFLLEWINSDRGRGYIRTVAKSTSGLNTINSSVLKAMPVPKLCIDDQDALLATLASIDGGRDALTREMTELRTVQSSLLAEIFGGN